MKGENQMKEALSEALSSAYLAGGDACCGGRPKSKVDERETVKSLVDTFQSTLWVLPSVAWPDEGELVVAIIKGEKRLAGIYWCHPDFEETFAPYKYWDDPYNEGQDWNEDDVEKWHGLLD